MSQRRRRLPGKRTLAADTDIAEGYTLQKRGLQRPARPRRRGPQRADAEPNGASAAPVRSTNIATNIFLKQQTPAVSVYKRVESMLKQHGHATLHASGRAVPYALQLLLDLRSGQARVPNMHDRVETDTVAVQDDVVPPADDIDARMEEQERMISKVLVHLWT